MTAVVLTAIVLATAVVALWLTLPEPVRPGGDRRPGRGLRIGHAAPAFHDLLDHRGRPVDIGGATGRRQLLLVGPPAGPAGDELVGALAAVAGADAGLDVVVIAATEPATDRPVAEPGADGIARVVSARVATAYGPAPGRPGDGGPHTVVLDAAGIVRALGPCTSRDEAERLLRLDAGPQEADSAR